MIMIIVIMIMIIVNFFLLLLQIHHNHGQAPPDLKLYLQEAIQHCGLASEGATSLNPLNYYARHDHAHDDDHDDAHDDDHDDDDHGDNDDHDKDNNDDDGSIKDTDLLFLISMMVLMELVSLLGLYCGSTFQVISIQAKPNHSERGCEGHQRSCFLKMMALISHGNVSQCGEFKNSRYFHALTIFCIQHYKLENFPTIFFECGLFSRICKLCPLKLFI